MSCTEDINSATVMEKLDRAISMRVGKMEGKAHGSRELKHSGKTVDSIDVHLW